MSRFATLATTGLALVLAVLPSCTSTPEAASTAVHHRIGAVHRPITTRSEVAQLWFDRGLALAAGFNHEEAGLCFAEAAAADPDCAMAHWGRAYVLGPNYNAPKITPEANAAALVALEQARGALDVETPVERALIDALARRHAAAPDAGREALDRDYAIAMDEVLARFPDDADVLALAAEARMQLRPWKLWSVDGVAAPETPQIVGMLEEGLTRWPDHALLGHLYVHAMEAGPDVARALPAARRLETLTPGIGHLVHMPSHIYVWTGHYEDVVRVNVEACRVDDAFAAVRGTRNFYTAYRIHNYHFVTYGAMWEGRRELAMTYARALPRQIHPDLVVAHADVFDMFHATPYHVMVRFGMWDAILAEPAPADALLATRPVWHYARGVALASLGRVAEAEREHAAFLAARDRVPASRTLFQNAAADVLAVGEKVLAGEIAYRRGEHERAFALLREAVALDDALNYDEPWGWMEPARHALGALLTEQGRHAEALEVYRRDLARYPENGWALHGLAECLEALGRTTEARDAAERFRRAWARADVTIPGSCFCRTKPA